jgi:hypothetical protein
VVTYPIDPDEGLPALAEGSRWEGSSVVDENGDAAVVATCDDLDVYSGELVLECIGTGPCNPFLADTRHAIARHDRSRGLFWADRMRGLAGELQTEPQATDGSRVAWVRRAHNATAHRILAVLDELSEDGQC